MAKAIVYNGKYIGMRPEGGTPYHLGVGDDMAAILNLVYPVGSYYVSMDSSFDPNTSFTGEWVKDTAGLMTMAASADDTVGSTGGEKTHAVTVSEMPSHGHTASGVVFETSKNGTFYNTKGTSWWNYTAGSSLKYERIYDATMTTTSTGSGTAHSNLQPYVVGIRWHRVA